MKTGIASLAIMTCLVAQATADEWYIVIKTSDIHLAGTDANIGVQLYGDKGTSRFILLDDDRNNYRRGATDSFNFSTENIGTLQKLIVNNDMTLLVPGWHLEKIVLQNQDDDMKYTWRPETWIWEGTHRGITYSNSLELPVVKNQTWKIQVKTSDKRHAGTDAGVYIKLYGTDGVSEDTLLDSPRDDFERGQLDKYNIKTHDIGQIEKIEVWHDNTNRAPGWHLSKIIINGGGKKYVFIADKWLNIGQSIDLVMTPTSKEK